VGEWRRENENKMHAAPHPIISSRIKSSLSLFPPLIDMKLTWKLENMNVIDELKVDED
jgi:hypothetical protein